MPLQGGLGRAHPGRASPGKNDAGGCGHASDGTDLGSRAAIVVPVHSCTLLYRYR
jgi:hypothetical protein